MVSANLAVLNKAGLHMRPAKQLCTEALEYKCKINIHKGDSCYNAKSVIGVLSAGVKYGDKITLECDGEDEERALKNLSLIISSGLGEAIIPLEQEEKVM